MIKKMLLKGVREGLGRVMVFVSFMTLPRQIQRSAEEQEKVEQQAKHMSIYQYLTCPFCIKTRRVVHRLNVPMEYRDAQVRGSEHRNSLKTEGGQTKVPCLRIDEGDQSTWLYESNDIIAYLNQQFDPVKN